MDGFALLVGHLVGDYILQTDYLAANKSNPWPGKAPQWSVDANPSDLIGFRAALDARNNRQAEYATAKTKWREGHFACLVHCLFYTFAVWLFSFWWMPWWGVVACFVCHFPIDRFRLAKTWMINVSGQAGFATGPLAPWSIIIVDNVFHLVTLVIIAAMAGKLYG